MALTNMVKGPAVAGLFIWRPISSRNLLAAVLYIYRLFSQIKNLPRNFVLLLIVLHHRIFYIARVTKARINDESLI